MKREHDGICHMTGIYHHLKSLIEQLTSESLPPGSLFLPLHYAYKSPHLHDLQKCDAC